MKPKRQIWASRTGPHDQGEQLELSQGNGKLKMFLSKWIQDKCWWIFPGKLIWYYYKEKNNKITYWMTPTVSRSIHFLKANRNPHILEPTKFSSWYLRNHFIILIIVKKKKKTLPFIRMIIKPSNFFILTWTSCNIATKR